MGILRGVFNALETKAATDEEATSHAIAGSASGRGYYVSPGQWDTEKAVKQGFEKVIWVFRCVDVIATNQSSVPIEVKQGYGKDGVVQSAPKLHELLNVRPNDYETAMQFRYRLTSMLLLSRLGAFIEVVGSVNNPQSLHLLPSHTVEPMPDPENFVRGYRIMKAEGTQVEVPPDDIIWIKAKPHPLDPYQQMTPLVAAGLAVDTDWMARMFNRNFLANDGRPGLLISVRGQVNKEDAEEIKARFSGGYDQAGKTTVIEGEGLDVADMSTSPRDVQWLDAITGSKQDIMLSFGVPESVMGNASGRTFDNADAEREGFWKDTMVPHCDAIANGLDVFTGSVRDNTHVAFDYSVIDVLQRVETIRHQRALDDWQAGKITWNEMREACGLPTWDNVLPANMIFGPNQVGWTKDYPDNADQIKELPMYGVPPAPAGMSPEQMEDNARVGALQGSKIGSRRYNNVISARTYQLRQRASNLAGKASSHKELERKSDDDDDSENVVDAEIVHPHEELRTKIEAMSEGMLLTWCERQAEVVQGRLDHAKVRKGTRHWDAGPEYKATKVLDADYVVEVDRWVADIKRDFESALRPVLMKEANRVAKEIEDVGLLAELHERGIGDPQQRTALSRLIGGGKHEKERVINQALAGVLRIIEKSTRNQAKNIADLVRDLEDDGASLDKIKREVSKRIGTRSSWRKGLSQAMATSAIEGLKETLYSNAGDLVLKTWNAIEDESTRESHFEVDGTTVAADEKFLVGRTLMDRPGDPTAPVGETANCRCWLTYKLNPGAAL